MTPRIRLMHLKQGVRPQPTATRRRRNHLRSLYLLIMATSKLQHGTTRWSLNGGQNGIAATHTSGVFQDEFLRRQVDPRMRTASAAARSHGWRIATRPMPVMISHSS
ncbi:MAG: hypothetical protein C0511_09125 [Hyphomicrobium sp.]|nr:hypothetical protein [Hyphomicrobium sp.]